MAVVLLPKVQELLTYTATSAMSIETFITPH